jgi:hypothetical protein
VDMQRSRQLRRPLRLGCQLRRRRYGRPKRQNPGLFIAAARAFKRVNGSVGLRRVKIDDGMPYRFSAFWADVIDDKVQRHVSSLSLWANGGRSKGSGKIVMVWGRTDALRWRLNPKRRLQAFHMARAASPFTALSVKAFRPTSIRREIPDPGHKGLYLVAARWRKVMGLSVSLQRQAKEADARAVVPRHG